MAEEIKKGQWAAFEQVFKRAVQGMEDLKVSCLNAANVFRQAVERAGYARLIAVVSLFAAAAVLASFAGLRSSIRAPLPSSPPPPVAPGAPPANYDSLRQEITNYTATLPGTYSIYFKDLASGQVLGINENAPIPDASCIKVPVVLYLYEQVAAGKLSWRDRVAYQLAVDYESGAGALQLTAEDGNTFSLRCLATIAITISDNIAHNMLVRYLGADNVMAFIRNIGGADTTRPYGSATTTAKDLGAFMEAVYHFAKQNPAQGRRLISDLGNTVFHVGLPGELPPDLLVAHKEGSISGVVNDMGIVFTDHPYVLTVMSQGSSDEDTGFHDIAEISRLVYEYRQQLR
jgi:beta-lactamase class A